MLTNLARTLWQQSHRAVNITDTSVLSAVVSSWPHTLLDQQAHFSSEPDSNSPSTSAPHNNSKPEQKRPTPAAPATDLFTQAMQSKAERQLQQMLEQQSRLSASVAEQQAQQHASGGEAEDDEDEEDDRVSVCVCVACLAVCGQTSLKTLTLLPSFTHTCDTNTHPHTPNTQILPNPETGEVMGPTEKNKGKEPTRFGGCLCAWIVLLASADCFDGQSCAHLKNQSSPFPLYLLLSSLTLHTVLFTGDWEIRGRCTDW